MIVVFEEIWRNIRIVTLSPCHVITFLIFDNALTL